MPFAAQEPAAAPALRFSQVFSCVELPGDCLNSRFDPGLYVTLLASDGSLCLARTGPEAATDEEVGEVGGTMLVEVKCKDPYRFELAVVSHRKNAVKDYAELSLEAVKDETLIEALSGRIKKEQGFDLGKTEVIWGSPSTMVRRYPHPSKEIYLVEYESFPGPFFIVEEKRITAGCDLDLCGGPVGAFRLNGRYYLETYSCACETDNCGTDHWDMDTLRRNEPEISGNE